MKYIHKFLFIFLVNFVFFCENASPETKTFKDSLLQINLVEELQKGNFLIGLKQYLGDNNKKQLNHVDLLFQSDEKFLNLVAANGVLHKSKKIKIVWEKIPLQQPRVIERQVLGPFASFESAKKKVKLLNSAGLNPVIAYPEDWELWLPKGNILAKKYKFKTKKIVYEYDIIPFLSSEFSHQKLEGNISISSIENIKINNILYGNNFYLVRDSYGTWSLIQKLTFDKYLEGVLPHEIGASSPLEALKAQAIIARTWAFYNSDRFKNDKYHLCITTQCQVYKPYLNPHKNIRKAIKDTTGLILTFQNKPINAFYHASNGGIMALSSESWQISNYPYFQTKFDFIGSDNADINLPFINESQINNFIENKRIDFLGDNHYLFRWEKRISSDTINNLLRQNKFLNKQNKISDIQIVDRGRSGRVTKLKVALHNSSEPIVFIKDDIRRYLKFLPSNLFIIDKLNDNFWIFKGGGFGHGVGLSQSGAIEMANLGFNYDDILSHYYSETEIKNIKYYSE